MFRRAKMFGIVLLLLPCALVEGLKLEAADALEADAGAPVLTPNTQFIVGAADSTIRSKSKPELHLGVGDDKITPGAPLVLRQCHGLGFELFDFDGKLIRVRGNKDFCLNVEGGDVLGNRIGTWPCKHGGEALAHEEFEFGKDGRIRLASNSSNCINVKESNFAYNSELVLWPCGEGDEVNDIFDYSDGIIKVRNHPDYHFRVKGDDVLKPSPVVLYHCLPKATEKFELMSNGQIRLREKHESEGDMCLNVKEGLAGGQPIILWPCTAPESADALPPNHERFAYDSSRAIIHSVKDPNLVFNAAGGQVYQGDPIIMFPLVVKHDEM